MKERPLADMLKGVVEVDETYVGARRPRKTQKDIMNGKNFKRGRATKKIPVLVLVERDGEAISKPLRKINAENLKSAIRETVNQQSTIITDDCSSYSGIGREFAGGHKTINHSLGQYVNGDITTNTAESYFALLKRGVHGTFHHVSKRHLKRYCDEFSFRWNHRKVNDGTRAEAAIRGVDGKRLTYKKIVC
jgi:transposase-like protein